MDAGAPTGPAANAPPVLLLLRAATSASASLPPAQRLSALKSVFEAVDVIPLAGIVDAASSAVDAATLVEVQQVLV